MKTLGDTLQAEIKRVREELLPVCDSIPNRNIAALFMRQDIEAAEKAIVEGDITAQIDVFERLKAWSL